MADEIKEEKKTPPEAPKEEDKSKKEPAPKEDTWQEIMVGKFTSPEELAKGYKELEKKFGKQSEEVRQAQEFATIVQPLLDEIRTDPELFKMLDERLRKRSEPTEPSEAKAKGEEKATAQDEMRSVASDLILARFEERSGIEKLPPDERRAIRQSIGDIVYKLTGQSFANVDLRRLPEVLENAFVLVKEKGLIDKSKLEALISAKGVEEAGIPSVPSSPGKAETALTSEEAEIAEKLGLAREQYLEGKKRLAK